MNRQRKRSQSDSSHHCWTIVAWCCGLILCAYFPQAVAAQENQLAQQGQVEAPFDKANILYEQGDYTAAAEAYRALIENGGNSAATYFNHGNALYKVGHIGRALVEYHKALAASPRDPDILANIQFTREKLGTTAVLPRSFWQQFLLQVTLNEWTIVTVIPGWIWLFSSGLGFFLGGVRTGLSFVTKLSGFAFLGLAIILFIATNERLGKKYAIVTTEEAVIRFGPFEESRSSHNLVDGIEVQLLDHKDGWHQIRDPKGQLGWLHQESVRELPPLP